VLHTNNHQTFIALVVIHWLSFTTQDDYRYSTKEKHKIKSNIKQVYQTHHIDLIALLSTGVPINIICWSAMQLLKMVTVRIKYINKLTSCTRYGSDLSLTRLKIRLAIAIHLTIRSFKLRWLVCWIGDLRLNKGIYSAFHSISSIILHYKIHLNFGGRV